MSEIRVRTGARLHFGMFACASPPSEGGSAGRQFGGAGLMIDAPAFDLVVRPAHETAVRGADPECEGRVRRLLARLEGPLALPPIEVEI
ncbi:MAG TPA: hypothetical protein VNC50_11460, partial [Planctomycetia bacterium]|nr:hypothetical protein [Planctomycetia bacterium]